jgi:hypothetical protein
MQTNLEDRPFNSASGRPFVQPIEGCVGRRDLLAEKVQALIQSDISVISIKRFLDSCDEYFNPPRNRIDLCRVGFGDSRPPEGLVDSFIQTWKSVYARHHFASDREAVAPVLVHPRNMAPLSRPLSREN